MAGAVELKERPVLSNRQRKKLERRIKAERAAMPKPERPPPMPAEYIAPVAKHEDDRIIPGVTGLGAVQRLDTLGKLYEAGKIDGVQYSAGRDYLRIVENYFATASGLAKLSDEAGRVGGMCDPIRLYVHGRRTYVPTQRPRNPSPVRAHSDGWSRAKLEAMTEFSRMARLVASLPRDPRTALCLLVIDPNQPGAPALDLANASRRLFGYKHPRTYDRLTRWLREALDELDGELMTRQAA